MYEIFSEKIVLGLLCFVFVVQKTFGQNTLHFGSGCNYLNPNGTNIFRLSLRKCREECGMRSSCHAVDYFRREQRCALIQTIDNYTSTGNRSCVHVTKEETKNPQSSECKTSDVVGMNCDFKDCLPFGEIQNGVVFGNINKVGSRLKIVCTPGYRRAKTTRTTECMPHGRWSNRPICPTITMGKACNNDIDCTEDGFVCIEGRCLCDPFYRYNVTSKYCVKECNRMTDEFTLHRNRYIRGYDTWYEVIGSSCRRRCIEKTGCFAYELFVDDSCYLNSLSYEMALDFDPTLVANLTGVLLYTRDCD